MQPFDVFPDKKMAVSGPISDAFLKLDITTFHNACSHVYTLPYGYNIDRDDLMSLFKEQMGSCTTKHAVIGTLAQELALPITKHIGIYKMDETIVTGTKKILDTHGLPYLPMIHCFLVFQNQRVDLTEGNRNGKNRPITDFLWAEQVIPAISANDEYRRYRHGLTKAVMVKPEFQDILVTSVLKAREKGLLLLRSLVGQN